MLLVDRVPLKNEEEEVVLLFIEVWEFEVVCWLVDAVDELEVGLVDSVEGEFCVT